MIWSLTCLKAVVSSFCPHSNVRTALCGLSLKPAYYFDINAEHSHFCLLAHAFCVPTLPPHTVHHYIFIFLLVLLFLSDRLLVIHQGQIRCLLFSIVVPDIPLINRIKLFVSIMLYSFFFSNIYPLI